MSSFITGYPQFFTATNLEWKPILEPDKYKDILQPEQLPTNSSFFRNEISMLYLNIYKKKFG
jgi:hypothetical protein